MEGEWQVMLEGNVAASQRVADAAVRFYSFLSIADRLTILYLAFVGVLVVVRQGHVRYWVEIGLIHAALIALIAMLAQLQALQALQARRLPVLEFYFRLSEPC